MLLSYEHAQRGVSVSGTILWGNHTPKVRHTGTPATVVPMPAPTSPAPAGIGADSQCIEVKEDVAASVKAESEHKPLVGRAISAFISSFIYVVFVYAVRAAVPSE